MLSFKKLKKRDFERFFGRKFGGKRNWPGRTRRIETPFKTSGGGISRPLSGKSSDFRKDFPGPFFFILRRAAAGVEYKLSVALKKSFGFTRVATTYAFPTHSQRGEKFL